jgi:type I restriction enzyme S subunit
MPYKTGLAIPHIYFKDYGKAKFYCPSIEEQSRIVSAMSSIEEKLQIEQDMLECMIKQKAHLLSNMFK